jgi:thioredoxin-like negative regulator of GroEL
MKRIIASTLILLAAIGQHTFAQQIVTITEKEFIEKVWDYNANPQEFVYKGTTPCIVDFYADWCGPCRKLATNLKTIAAKYPEQIIIYKIDVDNKENSSLVSLFGIQSIPYLLFANSESVYNHSGLLSVEQLEEVIGTLTTATDK